MLALERSCGRLSLKIIVVALLSALVLLASIPSLLAVSESPSVEWSRTYSELQANSVIQTADGGYAIVGYTGATPTAVVFAPNESYLYYGSAYVNHTAVLVKTDSSGELQWKKTYGTDVFGDDNNAVSVVQTSDLGYMLFGSGGYFVKTDAGGNVQWRRTVGLEVHVIGTEGVQTGIQTSDGDYFLVGNTIENNGENVAWLLKTDEQGNILQNKTFTGGFNIRTVIEANDRGCALAGSWRNDFWFAKIDSNSNLQWSQTYSYGETTDLHYVYSIAKTKDGGYVLAGAGIWQASGGLIPWLIKINSQGHEQWSLPYGHIPLNGFSSVVQTDDEGYMVALSDSAVLIRTDTSGSEKWNMTYADISGENDELPLSFFPLYRSSDLIQTKDGGYAIAGTVFESTTWLTKISPEPDVSPPLVSVSSPKNKTYDTGDVVLTFTVNEPASWIRYSLDGQDNVTITANITLSGLSKGAHNLAVYAKDFAGNIGASEIIHFSIIDRFPIEWVVASAVTVAAVSVGLLVYFKKLDLRRYFKKQTLIAIANNNMVRTLTIISLCIILILVQIFFPYFYFSSSSKDSNSPFEVGVTYVYERDNIEQVYDEVSRIEELGFSIIRVNMVCDSTEMNDYLNSLTDVFFTATQQLSMRVALVIQNHVDTNEMQYYLNRWGKYLSYVQILNEPELSSSWDIGALFTDDEIISKFQQVHSIVVQHQLQAQLYTNFGAGFVIRTNIPIQLSENLDFVGFDVFMESFLALSPNMIQLLHKITNKEVVITEFGMSTSDDVAQSDYIIKGLNFFKNMGLRGCWIVYWNSGGDYYGIRGRLAEKTVGEWIAQNAKTS
jgi:hypothetical protein